MLTAPRLDHHEFGLRWQPPNGCGVQRHRIAPPDTTEPEKVKAKMYSGQLNRAIQRRSPAARSFCSETSPCSIRWQNGQFTGSLLGRNDQNSVQTGSTESLYFLLISILDIFLVASGACSANASVTLFGCADWRCGAPEKRGC